ncbi:MAG: lactate utilization protein [Roseiflexaceae bacterium]|nr:lactate utilization protein [Roseiflexaceae bacterium]
MTTSRERMLAKIQSGLVAVRPIMEAEAALAPHAAPAHVHPAQDDLVAQFAAELIKLECFPHPCADDEEALDLIGEILAKHAAHSVIAWDLEQIGLAGLPALLAQQGISAHTVDTTGAGRAAALQELEPISVCISGAEAGIAESATVIVRGGAGRPRLASLLAPAYIAVLRRSQIARGLGEALATLRARHGDALFGDASSLTLISGPSRTADIELTLTLGVHGPREVHVLLIG